MKRIHWFEIALVAVIMGIHLYAAFSAPHNFSMTWFSRDDAYYYFKVAQNIVAGHGSTFDGINPTNGYHPLWMLVCLPIFALAQIDRILPLRVLLVVMAGLSAGTSVLIFRLLRKAIAAPVAMLAAAFWGFSPLVHSVVTQPGLETGITVLAIVLLLYLVQGFDEKWRSGPVSLRDIGWLAVAGLFVLFSRLDTIYLVLIVGVWVVFRGTPIRYLLPVDLLVTFSIIVLAYVQRTDLRLYLRAYTDSAMIAAGVTFAIQTVVFYFTGLYRHPKAASAPAIAGRALAGATISALVSSAALLGLSALGVLDLPRALPLIYWVAIFGAALLTRILVRAISPWPPQAELSPAARLRQSWRGWLADGSVYYGVVGGAVAIYMLLNKLWFDTPLPVSGQIKRWWSTMPDGAYGTGTKSILDLFGLDPVYSQAWSLLGNLIRMLVTPFHSDYWNYDRLFWSTAGLMAIVAVLLFLHMRRRNLRRLSQTALIPVLVSAELQVFFYSATGYTGEQEWYWVVQMLALTFLGALALNSLFELLPERRIASPVAWGVCLSSAAYLAVAFVGYIYGRMPYQDPWAGQADIPIVALIEKYTPPGAIIGITGGGDIAYFIKDRTIVNMDGLINSAAYFQAMQEGTGGQFLRNAGVKYVFGSYYILTESMPYRANLEGQLKKIRRAPADTNKQLMRLIP